MIVDKPPTNESRARRKIREAVERHGLEVDWMEYEPIGQMIEMSGREGGWTVRVRGCGIAMGYSWQEAVEHIDISAPMWKAGTLIG